MASLEPTSSIAVTAGATPDSVAPSVRRSPASPIRDRDPVPGSPFTAAGLDLFLHNDPDADGDALTVVVVPDGTPNGAHRSDNGSGEGTLWVEPSPRRFDVTSATSTNLALSGPIGVEDDENAMGVSAEVEVVNTREVPLLVVPIVDCSGFFQGPQPTSGDQPPTKIVATITATLELDGDTPVVVASDRTIVEGRGGSATIVLPGITVGPGSVSELHVGGSYKLNAALKLVYRGEVTEAFPVEVAGLTCRLQVIEYTSI